MKTRIFTILFLVLCVLGFSQNNESNYPNFIGLNIESVKNNLDWEILQNATGDLNKDGFEDYSLIIESKDSVLEKRCSDCFLLKNKARILLVFLNKDGEKKVTIQNNRFIARGDEGGMANYIEPELSIENQLLTIYYQFTRSNQSYTFGFRNDQMEIVRAESNGVESWSGNFESDKYDFIKNVITSEIGNISQDKVKTEIIKINSKPKTLSEFGEMYDWEIAENKYL
ncbi:hypothetical protein SAMN05216503_3346 [Polaribacter sp. KT25b]|uniref:hypothetical protein n=1 Tax=Polaribacter sp. KT25b TaxID=1855336 RepID=UPI00087B21B0|nr:hypothetical protein [Polaribacter sp. KT25b]SDS52710.1 hypothetical protein SAMN05216503_3346 [Polaribacter sp. KT25b]